MFNMPDNEWYTAKCYVYNFNQDQKQTEIRRKIDDETFEKDEDYDDLGVSLIPFSFRYQQFTETQERRYYGQTGKNNVNSTTIRTTYHDYKFKNDDRVKLMNQLDEESPKILVDVANNRNTYKSLAVFAYPGLYEEYQSDVILQLR